MSIEKNIGIRREDHNKWERRVPLVPSDVKTILNENTCGISIQPSKLRIFSEHPYEQAGAVISETLNEADIILAVKEIPVELLQEGKTYLFFSHTIKGQSYNMKMLQRMMDLKCNLIDYEKIVDEKNRRLIFFGRYAGLAGLIETIHAYGKKLKLQGIHTPFKKIKQAYQYSSVEEAKMHFKSVAHDLQKNGIPKNLGPVVFGFAGYGNVSCGAQELFDLLPHKDLSPTELVENFSSLTSCDGTLFKFVFKEEHMVIPKNGKFDLKDYYDNPENYTGNFSSWLPYVNVLVNCIYWTEKYPRLVTKDYLYQHPDGNLSVIGDISCDIEGSIEITHKSTYPDSATYTYFPAKKQFKDGTLRNGITIMAVDNLPCEFSKESSIEFSKVLREFIPLLIQENFSVPFEELKLPVSMKRGLILHQGKLTEDYIYIKQYLKKKTS